MKNSHPELEQYLARLETAMDMVAPSIRAELILYVKGRIEEMQANQGNPSLASVLEAMGDPTELGQRLILERGIDHDFKRQRSAPYFKWVTTTLIALAVAGVFSLVILVKAVTPIFEIDETKGRMRLFGGLIDVPTSGEYVAQYSSSKGDSAADFSGNVDLEQVGVSELRLEATNGDLALRTSKSGVLSWQCHGNGMAANEEIIVDGSVIEVDLSRFEQVACHLEVPTELAVAVRLVNGQLTLRRPLFAADIELTNGNVIIDPDPDSEYQYDLKVQNGVVDPRFRTTGISIPIRVDVANGSVLYHGDQ